MSSFINIIEMIRLVLKWKKHLVIIAVISIIASIIFSAPFFIDPQFKSYAILYPSNLVSYGGESTTEQMLQLFESEDLEDSIVKRFNLVNHYEIDTSLSFFKTKLHKEYQSNISFKKTEYQSVKITVYDKNPVIATNIVSSLVKLFDEKVKNLNKKKYGEVIKIVKKQLDEKKQEIDAMENTLKNIRVNYGILNYSIQSDVSSKEYIEALIKNRNQGNNKEVQKLIKNLEEKGGEFIAINEYLWHERGVYNGLKKQHEDLLKDYEKTLTYSHIISRPFPSDKKSYPIRWLIVLGSFSATMFLSLLIIFGIENYNKYKKLI